MITDEEIQAGINKLRKGKASDNNGIRAEDIKTCDTATKETIKQIFNEVSKQESCTPETWRRIRIKVIHRKGNEEDIARFVLCRRCTNCFRLSGTTDFVPSLTKLNQKMREGSGVLTKTEMPRAGCRNVDCDDRLHEGIRLH